MNYFMSDPHFGHKNILKFSRSQFYDVEQHNQYLLQRINDTVGFDDKLFILGDVAFNSEYWHLADINCQNIVIILGNHDYPSKFKQMLEVRGDLKFTGALAHTPKGTEQNWILTHIPVHESQLARYTHNIHGHLHQFYIDDKRYCNVSMEHLDDFKPISQEELVEKLKRV
jgi:calcineurin-like phosphoesterase family protein